MMNHQKSSGTMQQTDSNQSENNSIIMKENAHNKEENKQLVNDAKITDAIGNVAIDDQGKLLINEDEKESLEEIEEEEEEALIIVKDDSQAEELASEKMPNKHFECDFVEVKDSSAEAKPKNEPNYSIENSPTKDEKLKSEEIELIERQSACNIAPKLQLTIKHQSSPSKMAEKHQSSPSKVTEKPQPTKTTSQSEEQSDLASSIWIRNITSSTKATDLKALFSKHGKVLKAKIFTTKNKQNPTCFGYVTLTDPETADLCIENANRLNFKGRVIHVEKADRSNLSQINKNTNSSGQSQQQKTSTNKTDKNQPRSSESAEQKSKTKGIEPKRSSSSSGTKRPRITASKETHKERESSSNCRASSYHSNRGGCYENESRSRLSSTYASSRRPPAPGRTDYGHGYKAPTEHSKADQQYPVRRIVKTSKGVCVTTYPYSRLSRMTGVEANNVGFRSSSSYHGGSSNLQESSSSADKDREEMLRLMRRREEEHRKKEEELRLEREREKLKYEREKLEREKLELETYKLHAQLAQAAHLQITGLPTAATLTSQAAAMIGSSAVVHHPFIQQPPQQQQYHRTDETGSSSTRRNETVPAKDERKVEKRRSSKDETNRRRGHDGRSKRSRSRSPHRRQDSSRGRGGRKSDRTSSTGHRDQRSGVSRYDRLNEETSQTKRVIGDIVGGKHPQSKRNDEQYNNKSGGFYYGAGTMPAARNFGDQQQFRSDRRSSPQAVRTREFFASNDRFGHSSTTDAFNVRTDPTYASRIGGGSQAHQPAANRATEELLGNAGFGVNLQQQRQDHYIGQQQYRREPIGSGSSNNQFFQTNPSWDSPNKTATTSNARSYINTGGSVWNSGADWNTYGAGTSSSSQQGGQSASGSRFQPYGKPGNSYSSGGRRY